MFWPFITVPILWYFSVFKEKLASVISVPLKSLDALTDQTAISASKATIQENIDTLIEQFDNYEYYLY